VPVKIRLMRVGKKKQPSYRVVVADSRSPRDGRYIEIIGHYQPRQEPSAFTVDDEKVLGWLRQGAQPSEQVHRLLVGAGVWERYESELSKTSAAAKTAAAKEKGAKAARAAREAAAKAEAEAQAAADAAAAAEAAAAEAESAAAEPEAEAEAPADESSEAAE
jgi:small subunit ribosomal protein S16